LPPSYPFPPMSSPARVSRGEFVRRGVPNPTTTCSAVHPRRARGAGDTSSGVGERRRGESKTMEGQKGRRGEGQGFKYTGPRAMAEQSHLIGWLTSTTEIKLRRALTLAIHDFTILLHSPEGERPSATDSYCLCLQRSSYRPLLKESLVDSRLSC
jgi:hypothetical protein